MAIKRRPPAWVAPTPYGRIHVVTDASVNHIYWVSSVPIFWFGIPLFQSTSFRNDPNLHYLGEEQIPTLGVTEPAFGRTFVKWWNYVWFTPYEDVYAHFGPSSFHLNIVNNDPRLITLINLPADVGDGGINLFGNTMALGIQGDLANSDPRLLALGLYKDFHDPYRDPAYNP